MDASLVFLHITAGALAMIGITQRSSEIGGATVRATTTQKGRNV
jgi:hypothetical protein